MSKSKTTSESAKAGIPDALDLNEIKKWVQGRVSERRYQHIKGVVKAGKLLCYHHNVENLAVVLACWLHDSCKEIKASELYKLAIEKGLDVSEFDESNAHILHGPVGAAVVREKFGIESHDVLSAIAEHTLGNTEMTTVSKLVYLADALEESRPDSVKVPILNALIEGADLKNKKEKLNLNLDRAIYVASDLVLTNLIEKGKPIHPKTVRVRNHFLELSGKSAS